MEHKEKTYDIGVIIGRFQIAELHEGQEELLKRVIAKHKRVLILLGVAATLGTKANPLDFNSRMGLFSEYTKDNPNIMIHPIPDMSSDKFWSENVDKAIRTFFPLGTVRLYGGRDSFVDSYHGSFDTYEYLEINSGQGTLSRENTGKVVRSSIDFRRGQIYQSQQTYPKLFMTTDIAVIRQHETEIAPCVVLGNKIGRTGLNFPGGFVDPTDKDLESAAIRELMEETCIETDRVFKYIGSCQIDDWRYQKEERIITSLFLTSYLSGSLAPRSEFSNLGWYALNDSSLLEKMEPEHRILLNNLRTHLEVELI